MMKAAHIKTGYTGERYVQDILEARGYDVQPPMGDKCGDLGVFDPLNGCFARLEVKTANRGQDGGWQFCLRRDGHTDCGYADIVALVFIDKRKKYVRYIHTSHLIGVKKISFGFLPDEYVGRWSKLWTEQIVIGE